MRTIHKSVTIVLTPPLFIVLGLPLGKSDLPKFSNSFISSAQKSGVNTGRENTLEAINNTWKASLQYNINRWIHFLTIFLRHQVYQTFRNGVV